jgi:CUB/sushi domain-containing protein
VLSVVIDCGELQPSPNVVVYALHTTYQSHVNFTCEDGYNLVGSSSTHCLANGSWSNEMPQCIS